MTPELRDKLAGLAIIMLARRLGRGATLPEGFCVGSALADETDFVNFVRMDMPVNTEYGVMLHVPRRILDELDVSVTVEEDHAVRAFEVVAIMERPQRKS